MHDSAGGNYIQRPRCDPDGQPSDQSDRIAMGALLLLVHVAIDGIRMRHSSVGRLLCARHALRCASVHGW